VKHAAAHSLVRRAAKEKQGAPIMSSTSLASLAYEKLRQALDNFQYVPGDRFSENEVGAISA
jgi:DNA-binding GntR family transcriptional regulator